MTTWFLLAAAFLVVIFLFAVIMAALAVGEDATDYPETQDDFTASVARWGYLHDKRQS